MRYIKPFLLNACQISLLSFTLRQLKTQSGGLLEDERICASRVRNDAAAFNVACDAGELYL
ncbi:MAG: hypothetical protein V4573_08020 [Pseudomonadota bacterium]